jgi:hypothetical protein
LPGNTSATKIPTSISHRIKDDLSASPECALIANLENGLEGPQDPAV